MHEHHRQAIDKLVDRFKEDSGFPALIIASSIVKGSGHSLKIGKEGTQINL